MDDISVISALATKVRTAYQDAPHEFRHISEEVQALQVLIDKVTHHFKITTSTLSSDDRRDGQRILKGCHSILEDLNSLFEKYKSRAFY